MAAPARTIYSPDDLLSMPDFGRYELVDGQLLERNVSKSSSRISTRIIIFLGHFVVGAGLGVVFQADLGLRIYADPSKVRFSDGSFYARGHEESPDGSGYLHTAPDLVIEVVSPNDIATDVNVKVREYLEAGVQLVWVVYPETRSIDIYRPDGNDAHVGLGGTLSGEDVVPGFSLPVSQIFDL